VEKGKEITGEQLLIQYKLKEAYCILLDAVKEHDSNECGVIAFETTINGKTFCIEVKATEKELENKLTKNWDKSNQQP
jgi:hypothetical protein